MTGRLKRFFMAMRPAFTRKTAFLWFVCVFAGLIPRTDGLGVTSIARALALSPECHNSLLNFFRSSAWRFLGKDPITQVIREKQKSYPNTRHYEDVA